jgi:hypothetical protein
MAGLESAGLTIGGVPSGPGVWCARMDSNQHCTAFEAAASAWLDYGRIGRLGRIRTDTGRGLSTPPLPVGLRACGVRGETRTRNNAVLDRTRLPVAPPEHWWAVKDSNLGCFPKGYRVYSPALSASQPTAQTRIVKDLAEGRRLERRCPAGPWLSRPVGYQLPEPSGYKFKMWFVGKLQT